MCVVHLSGTVSLREMRVLWSDIYAEKTIAEPQHHCCLKPLIRMTTSFTLNSIHWPKPSDLTTHREKRRDRIRKRDGFLPSCLPHGPFCILYVSVSYIPCNHCLPACLLALFLSLFFLLLIFFWVEVWFVVYFVMIAGQEIKL